MGQLLWDGQCGTVAVGQSLWDGRCGTVVVEQLLWDSRYSLVPVDYRLVTAGCCSSVTGLSLSQSIAMILIRCKHLRKYFHCKASGVVGEAAGKNLNRPPPLPILTHAKALTNF